MDCSMPGSSVLHFLTQFAQIRVHWVGDALTIYSAIPFSCCLQSFPASESFPTSQLFTSGSQSIGTLTSASVLLMNIQGYFSLGLTGLVSLLSKGLSRVFFSTTFFFFFFQHHNLKASVLQCSAFIMAHISHPYMTTGNTIPLTKYTDIYWQSDVSAF